MLHVAIYHMILHIYVYLYSFQLLLELGIDPDARHFSYPDFYLDPHNEEHWCWDPDTMLLKVNTSLFVR